jgi:hypothetical protein
MRPLRSGFVQVCFSEAIEAQLAKNGDFSKDNLAGQMIERR